MYQTFQCKAKKGKVFHIQNKMHNATCTIHSFSKSQKKERKKDTIRKRSYNKMDAESEFCQGFIHGCFSQ